MAARSHRAPCFDARAEYAPLLASEIGDGMPKVDPAGDLSELKKSRTIAGRSAAGAGTLGRMLAETTEQVQPRGPTHH